MAEAGNATSGSPYSRRPPPEVVREFNHRGLQWLFEDPENVFLYMGELWALQRREWEDNRTPINLRIRKDMTGWKIFLLGALAGGALASILGPAQRDAGAPPTPPAQRETVVMTARTPAPPAPRSPSAAVVTPTDPTSLTSPGAINRRPYALQIVEHKTGRWSSYSSYYSLRVYDQATDETVWSRTVRGYATVDDSQGWSEDRRALVVAVQRFEPPREAILFWRDGHRIWVCPRDRRSTGEDYEFGPLVWSEDRNRVLFRAGNSGADLADVGILYCADIRARKLYLIAHVVRKMEWAGPRKVRYWTATYDETRDEDVVSEQFQEWRIPAGRGPWYRSIAYSADGRGGA